MSFGVKYAIFGVSSGYLRGEAVSKNYATKVQKINDICKLFGVFFTYFTRFSYTKGILRVYKRQASFPDYTKNAANMQFIAKTFGHIKYFHYLCSRNVAIYV